MTLKKFIEQNRGSIDETIKQSRDFVPRQAGCDCNKQGTDHYHSSGKSINDEERRQWVLNDEGLYNLARREGVKI